MLNPPTAISIHLMFLLIRGARFLQAGSNRISIHLMFLLIYSSQIRKKNAETNFNTSHVSINQCAVKHRRVYGIISIHLMFLLIRQDTVSSRP